MVEKTLDFFQIYYREDQLPELYPFAKPVFNQTLTPYFENDIISSLVPSSNADLVSVASWRLKQKRSAFPSKAVLHEAGSTELTKERILSTEFDIAILTPRLSEHKMLFMARHWHGQGWIDSFSELSLFLGKNLGIKVPIELSCPIYGNHFIARGEIYGDYVRSCLIPVIHFMNSHQSVFSKPAGYRARKEFGGNIEAIRDYEMASGRKEWMIGVFLLERLFSMPARAVTEGHGQRPWFNNGGQPPRNYSLLITHSMLSNAASSPQRD